MENAFYLVWNQNGGAPTVKHDSRQSAINEAERLARKCPGERFVVLRAVEGRVVDAMQRVSFDLDADEELPF